MHTIEGKAILITGASSGIGEATARHLAGAGSHRRLGARRTEHLARLVARIKAAGGKAQARVLDVTSRQDCHAFAEAALGCLDASTSSSTTRG